MNTNQTKARLILIAMAALGCLPSLAIADQILTGAQMETFLDDSFVLEDFEGVNLHGGGVWPAANPLNDSTITSFFNIEPGVTYSSTVALSFFGGFVGGTDSVLLRGDNDLTLTFDQPQAGVGFLLFGSVGSRVITFYNGTDALGSPVESGSAFIGWADTTAGITSVTITSTTLSLMSMDDMMFGANPSCPADLNFDGEINTADLGILIAAFGTSNPAGDANNDGIVDTADLGILIAVFDSNCP